MTDDTPNTQKYSAQMHDILCRLYASFEFGPQEVFFISCIEILRDEVGPLLKQMEAGND